MSNISENALLALQAIRVKGFATTETVSESVSLVEEDVFQLLNGFAEEGKVIYRETFNN